MASEEKNSKIEIQNNVSYKQSGVDTHLAQSLIQNLSSKIKKTYSSAKNGHVVDNFGLFAGVFQPNDESKGLEIVATTDGVGTKIEFARKFNKIENLGQDLVAMCVNDLYCLGAKPAFFLDYISCGKLDNAWYEKIISSIAESCIKTNMALLGGETAEHPGVMKEEEFDLAGFCVGFVDSKKRLPKLGEIKPKDKILAIGSSGLHSNGFSLVRKIFERIEKEDSALYRRIAHDEQFIDQILMPTRLYTEVPDLIEKYSIKAVANITGGGLYENIPRVIPKEFNIFIEDKMAFNNHLFDFFRKYSLEKDLYSTLNMGIGMIFIVDEESSLRILSENSAFKEIGFIDKKNDSKSHPAENSNERIRLKGIDY